MLIGRDAEDVRREHGGRLTLVTVKPPMRYLCNARFEKVREALARAHPGESVTIIAMPSRSVPYREFQERVPSRISLHPAAGRTSACRHCHVNVVRRAT
jgi:hypothetical protein